jgi:DNA-binding FadR family transcriptional regulator
VPGEPLVQTKPLGPKELLRHYLREQIELHIRHHRLRPGDRLPNEMELSRQLGVSRSSIREAVKALEGLGIVEVRSGLGLFVGSFSFDVVLDQIAYGAQFNLYELQHVLDMRQVIEEALVDRAVESSTPEQLYKLRTTLMHMRDEAEHGLQYLEHDREVHRLLYAQIDNPLFGRILDVFWLSYRPIHALDAKRTPELQLEHYERHVRIVDALEARDSDAMRAALAAHYDFARRGIVRAIEVETSDQQKTGEQSPEPLTR